MGKSKENTEEKKKNRQKKNIEKWKKSKTKNTTKVK